MGANTGYHQERQAILVSTKTSLGSINYQSVLSFPGWLPGTELGVVGLGSILLPLKSAKGQNEEQSFVVLQSLESREGTRPEWPTVPSLCHTEWVSYFRGRFPRTILRRETRVHRAGSASPQTREDS